MKVFKEIIRVTFKFLFSYKWTFAITAVTQPFALYIFMSLFKRIYEYNHTDISIEILYSSLVIVLVHRPRYIFKRSDPRFYKGGEQRKGNNLYIDNPRSQRY
jgi:hypothetical protein